MNLFRSGTVEIDAGELEKEVSGLSLPFSPRQVIVSVRQPSENADIITAVVVGTPTEDGFTVALSSPAQEDGYLLDWCATTDEQAEVDEDTLSVDYTALMGLVARFLGYTGTLTEAQTAEVDGYVQSGLRQFYYPPKVEGVDEHYEWSFMRRKCSISTTAGVPAYRMADGFGKVQGQIEFLGDDLHLHPLRVVPIHTLRQFNYRQTGIPKLAAFQWKAAYGARGQYAELVLWPKPDRAYTLGFMCECDTGRLNADTRPFPLGGSAFAELLSESCLAIAEQRANDEAGIHTEKFKALLASMVAKDRGSSGASFGQMGDRPDNPAGLFSIVHPDNIFRITYHGDTW